MPSIKVRSAKEAVRLGSEREMVASTKANESSSSSKSKEVR